ncbi:MAG: peptide chain release factor N(5)-glutamine methyltransferase [Bacteroides sp.]|nr:peptide chain release factor N(5)-glutamine methyltransferase [Bacteroides sp.]MCM1448330.1 peptide chain release factor N(5)-glutamine methyltransferase [Bacteroides sp.]
MNHLKELQNHYGPAEGRALYRMVMEECFGLTHTDILLGKDNEISEEQQQRLNEITGRLLKNEPIQYVLGRATFRGRSFEVCPGVLIPRPETEMLVDTVSSICASMPASDYVPHILDIGTGSGCIAVSLAMDGYRATAMDISTAALDVASRNAAELGAEVEFIQEDILQPSPSDFRWDIIVSNPPYVCLHEAAEMEPNVLLYEPHNALFVPDTDPLIFYRAISAYAMSHLTAGGWLCLEINRAYPREITDLLTSFGFVDVNITPDQYGNLRIASAHL